MADNKDIEIMRQIIARKKEKSASQGSVKRGPQDRYGATKPSKKKNKKGGPVSDENTESGNEA